MTMKPPEITPILGISWKNNQASKPEPIGSANNEIDTT